jgi:molybdopterin-synthase adenylyltransferase
MPRIVFCGVGALGSNAVVACRSLDATFALVDHDRVESKNCLAQAFVKASIGKNKAEAMRLQLGSFWGVKAEAFPVRLVAENVDALCGSADLVVETFDDAPSRRLLSSWAQEAQAQARARAQREKETRPAQLLHAGLSADGTFGLVRWEERFAADEPPPHGGSGAGAATCRAGEHLPLVTLVAAALAVTVQAYVERGERIDRLVSRTYP